MAVAALVLLALLVIITTREWLVLRARVRQRGVFRRWPIPKVSVEILDSRFEPDELGPTLAGEIHYIGRGTVPVPGGTSDTEAWILAVLAKSARRMFEFGTCTGKTAYLWARNQPAGGQVITLTLPPGQLDAYRPESGDAALAEAYAREESRFTRYRYSETDAARQVTQLFGDSKVFDEAPYAASCDVVFVDGSHAYSYVVNDSAKALVMLRPGGLILWHDYSPECPGVFRALNELSRRIPLVHVTGTNLVAHRSGAGAPGLHSGRFATALAAVALGLAVPRVMPAQGPLAVAHLAVRLADVSVAADTLAGLQVIVQPGVLSKEGKSIQGLIWLRFHPDTALEWINSAVAAIGTPVANGPAEGIQWSRTLLPIGGKGALALGRSRKKGKLQSTHWLAVADSGTGWRIELTGAETDSLLRLVLTLGSQSRLDSTSAGALDAEAVDIPVVIEHQPTPQYRGVVGRVIAEFVVGTDGHAEPESFVAYIASDPKLIDEARDVIRQSRFRPAMRGGHPVRRLVRQAINWLPGRP